MEKYLRKFLQVFIGKEQLKDTLYLSVANTFARLVGFFMPFVLIYFASEEVYGKFAFILNTLSTVIAVFSAGLTNAVSRYLSHGNEEVKQSVFDELLVKSIRLILVVTFAAILFFLLGHFAFKEIETIRTELLIGVFYIFFTLVGSFVTGYYYVKQHYLKLSISIFVPSILQIILLVPAAKYFGLNGIVFVYVLFSLSQLFILLKKESAFKWQSIKSSYGRFIDRKGIDQGVFLKFVLPISIASVAVPISVWYANHKVALLFGYSDLGFINIAIQMQVIMAFLPNIFNSMAIPVLSRTFKENRGAFITYLKGLALKTMTGSGIIFLLLFVFANEVLAFYSADYIVHANILRVFLVSFYLSVLLNVLGVVILSVASMWWGAALNIIWALSFVWSIIVLIPMYGLIGFAYGYIISYSIHLLTTILYTIYFIKKNT